MYTLLAFTPFARARHIAWYCLKSGRRIVSNSYSNESYFMWTTMWVWLFILCLCLQKLPKISLMPNVCSMVGVGGCSRMKRLNDFLGQFSLLYDVLLVICRASLFFFLHRCTIPHDNSFSVDWLGADAPNNNLAEDLVAVNFRPFKYVRSNVLIVVDISALCHSFHGAHQIHCRHL